MQRTNHYTHSPKLLSSKCNTPTKQIKSVYFVFSKYKLILLSFQKPFSYFPHGTCVLSVSVACLPLHETYHPLCIPMPRSVTQQIYTVHKGLHMANRILTLIDALFQYAGTCTSVGNTFPQYNSKPIAPCLGCEAAATHPGSMQYTLTLLVHSNAKQQYCIWKIIHYVPRL